MSWSVIPTNMNTGVRRLRTTLGALWGLGTAPQADTIAELEDSGWDPQRINVLLQLNVTDEQLQALPYPASDTEMTAAYNALALQLSQAPTAAPPATPLTIVAPSPAPAATSASGSVVPAGSRVAYTATFTPTSNVLSANFYSIDSVVAAIVQNLQNVWHISVIGQQSSGGIVGTPTIALTLQTTVAYGALSDLKSIVDGAFYNAAGAQVTSSQIAVTAYGAGAPAVLPIGNPAVNLISPAGASASPNLTVWFEQNAGSILLALAATVLGMRLVKKVL
jgi:hypothetical protein